MNTNRQPWVCKSLFTQGGKKKCKVTVHRKTSVPETMTNSKDFAVAARHKTKENPAMKAIKYLQRDMPVLQRAAQNIYSRKAFTDKQQPSLPGTKSAMLKRMTTGCHCTYMANVTFFWLIGADNNYITSFVIINTKDKPTRATSDVWLRWA